VRPNRARPPDPRVGLRSKICASVTSARSQPDRRRLPAWPGARHIGGTKICLRLPYRQPADTQTTRSPTCRGARHPVGLWHAGPADSIRRDCVAPSPPAISRETSPTTQVGGPERDRRPDEIAPASADHETPLQTLRPVAILGQGADIGLARAPIGSGKLADLPAGIAARIVGRKTWRLTPFPGVAG
jgi:hypothetical protein